MTQPPVDLDLERAKREKERQREQNGKGKPKAQPKEPPDPLVHISALEPGAIEQCMRRKRGDEIPVESPWAALNNTLGGGLWAGLHVLVAGTGVGKTQLSLQIASHCAARGTPVGLVVLELDESQLLHRLREETCRVSWSRAFYGHISDAEATRLQQPSTAGIPIYADFGDAHGWPSTRLEHVAYHLRKRHPTGPALIVLDFLQLVASDGPDSRIDLRERIGIAAYRARNVARRFGVSVLVISSTSRESYKTLNEKMSKAGLVTERRGHTTRRAVLYPDTLIGTGKEAGEIEYAADSVTVLMRPVFDASSLDPEISGRIEQGAKIIVAATVKVRAGETSWFAFAFARGRLEALSETACNSIAGERQQKTREDPLERVRAVVTIVQHSSASEPLPTPTAISKLMPGRRQDTFAAIKAAIDAGHIRLNPIEKRYVLGPVPLPSPAEQPITSATPSPEGETNDEQGQLF
jgi:replicative DNA helicase